MQLQGEGPGRKNTKRNEKNMITVYYAQVSRSSRKEKKKS